MKNRVCGDTPNYGAVTTTGSPAMDTYVMKGLILTGGLVYEHFKDLLPMLDCLAVGAAMRCWHEDSICPFWQRHQIRLVFF
jgi:hypothetical protein